jgi:uncharacterized membrane protein
MTSPAIVVHVSAGTIALISGVVAVSCLKGGRAHRVSGTVFFISMLVMAALADYLAITIPDQLPNLFIGTFAIYLVATAWLAARRQDGSIGVAEKIALAVSVCLCAPFAILSFQLALGLQPFVKSAVPLVGVVRVAIFVITFMLAMAAIGDVRTVLAGGLSGARRIGRHLWRMCLGLTFAAGSAFTNGLPRLLPPSVRIPLLWLFIPQLTALALMFFWIIRVRFTGWYRAPTHASTCSPHQASRTAIPGRASPPP